MDTYKLKFTLLQNEIFRLLCINAGEKLNQRQIAKHLKATPTGIAQALQGLIKENLVKVEKSSTMNLNLVFLNRDQKTLKLKQIENLKQINESSLAEHLEEAFPGTTIILFGSYCRGEDTLTSDIDIAIIGAKPKSIALISYEKLLERKINLNYYDSLKAIDKELRENLCNGIVLAGAIEL